MKHRTSLLLKKIFTILIISASVICILTYRLVFSFYEEGKIDLAEKQAIIHRQLQRDYSRYVSSNSVWPAKMKTPYPECRSLLAMLTDWNPNNVEPPSNFVEKLQHFDYNNADDMEIAEKFRTAELPYKMYNVPDFINAARKWNDDYLIQSFDMISNSSDSSYTYIEKSKNNHFLFWQYNDIEGYEPPTEEVKMNFKTYQELAHYADYYNISNTLPHYYFESNSDITSEKDTFISQDLGDFFLRHTRPELEEEVNKVNCKWGMRANIAEPHYDMHNNFIGILHGSRRYIITPPSTCKYLQLITDSNHPSYRHSTVDWSDIYEAAEARFDKIDAVETIIRPGEVMFLPNGWIHYLTSLEYNIQCNAFIQTPSTPPRHDMTGCYDED